MSGGSSLNETDFSNETDLSGNYINSLTYIYTNKNSFQMQKIIKSSKYSFKWKLRADITYSWSRFYCLRNWLKARNKLESSIYTLFE